MRKLAAVLMMLVLLTALIGVPVHRLITNFKTMPPEAFPLVRWCVTVESTDVHALAFEYCIDRKFLGGTSVSVDAKSSRPFPAGERIMIEIPDSLLPEEGRMDGCMIGVVASITDKNGQEFPLETLYEWAFIPDEPMALTLSGSRDEGYTLSAAQDRIVATPLSLAVNELQ